MERELKEKERLEKEKKEKEKTQAKNFPKGISSDCNISEKQIKFIHLDIKFKSEVKNIEIFDIYAPSKKGYKVICHENINYFIVFPFYKTNREKIFFGIRDIKTKSFIDNKDIMENDFLKYNESKNRYELEIIKTELMMFNIYNVPVERNNVTYLKYINKMNLEDYQFSLSNVKEVTKSLKYYEILDIIMEIGINPLSDFMIKILNDRKIDLYQISEYLEKNKENKFKEVNYEEITPYIILNLGIENELKDDILIQIPEENMRRKRDCLLCCDKNIPTSLYSDNYQKDLIPNTIKYLGDLSIKENKLKEMKEKINHKILKYNQT